ncbi:MAG TPA: iron-sulfur cluster assembly scaffold protein [Thermomicrobiales bacterium]|nr:iron-sulfur cluster assembly scaffold protein [Thermomicrobiales bacterium]
MSDAYSPQVLDHFARPRNLGRLPDADGRGAAGDRRDGTVWIEVAIRVAGEVVADARFRALGCSAAIAASSMATTLIAGRPVAAAGALTADEITAALGGLPAARLYAPALAAEAVRAAVADYARRGTAGEGRTA